MTEFQCGLLKWRHTPPPGVDRCAGIPDRICFPYVGAFGVDGERIQLTPPPIHCRSICGLQEKMMLLWFSWVSHDFNQPRTFWLVIICILLSLYCIKSQNLQNFSNNMSLLEVFVNRKPSARSRLSGVPTLTRHLVSSCFQIDSRPNHN